MEKRKDVTKLKGNPLTLLGKEIKKGDKAPDFTVNDSTFQPRNLSDFAGYTRILSIFPSVDTSVCSAQAHRFNKEASSLQNTKILTLSNDLPFALKRFCAAEGIESLEMLSDHKDLDFGYKYGFVIEEMRLLTRGVVVIDKNDVVQYVQYVPEFGHEPDYEKALEVVRKLT
jgi:thioredoxin-dependent peroxiredoxin